jgi:putative ABC transport system substrate-binding protein
MSNRRQFITLLGGAAATWPLAARAQQPAMLRIGAVSGQPRTTASIYMAFEQRMAELGYLEGKNFVFEFIQAARVEEFAPAYRELAARKVDIFVATGPEISLRSALVAAEGRPIVMIAIDYDPLALGYVTSLARPAGNITGVFFRQIELTIKRLQIVKDAFPDMQSAIVFWDRISADQWNAAQSAAPALGLRLTGIELREQPYDYEKALAQAQADHHSNLFVMTSPFFFRDRAQLADLALRHRMISMFAFREWVDAGGLLSPSITGMYRRAADYVDRIARGAKPEDLPIEQPTKFELVVNLKTARAVGIELATAILLRADEVIE